MLGAGSYNSQILLLVDRSDWQDTSQYTAQKENPMQTINMGTGGGGCYIDFRKTNPIDNKLIVDNLFWNLKISDDFKNVTYRFNYQFSLNGDEVEYNDWTWVSPYPESNVRNISAKDSDNESLRIKKCALAEDNKKTLITIYFSKPLNKNNQERDLEFSFTAPIESSITKKVLGESVSFYDWMINNCLVKKTVIKIELPPKSIITNFIPQTNPPIESSPIILESVNTPPNGLFSFMVNLERQKVGKKFWSLVISLLFSGIIGYFVNLLLNFIF